MNTNTNNTNGGGVGFSGLLTILFIGLKLTGVITWSWWWVMSPIWISVSLGVVLIFIGSLMVWFSERVN